MRTLRIKRLLDDLAGYWTEPVLEILKMAGKARVSVQGEIEAWYTLNAALKAKMREQRALGTTSSLSAVREQVLASAVSQLAGNYSVRDEHFQQLTQNRPSTAAEHRLFQELVREPMASSAFNSARQTDFVPRFQLSALAG